MSMAPGWYPDPFSRGYLRWWDGTAWATATRLAEEPLDAPPVPQPTTGPQPPAAAPQQPAAPQYPAAPAYPPVQPYPGAPQYGEPPQQYGAPPQQYGAPPQQYGAPPAYGGPPPGAPGYPPQQPPWSGYQPYPPPAPQPTVPLASWGQRFAARLIDWLILAVVLVPLYLVTLWPAFTDLINQIPTDPSQPLDPNVIFRFEQRVIGQALLLGLIGAVVQMVYEVPQLAAYGRTVGMRVIGLRVRPLATDRNPSWGESLIRTGVAVGGNLVAGVIFTLIDDLWPLWDKPWRQAIHDKAAKTIVVLK